MNIEIDNITHPLMKLTQELLSVEGCKQNQKFIIDDPENILVAIEAGVVIEHVFFYGDHATRHHDFLQAVSSKAEIHPIRPRTCKKIFGVEKMARVFAIAQVPKPVALLDLQGDLGVLDGLMMTGNMGAIMRSALAFNVGGLVILNKDIAQLYDRRLIRASKGSIFKLPVVAVEEKAFFDYCSKVAIKTVCCSQKATHKMQQVCADTQRLAFILGSEKHGVSNSIEEHADEHICIPMTDQVESLNVSVAAAIIFQQRFAIQSNSGSHS